MCLQLYHMHGQTEDPIAAFARMTNPAEYIRPKPCRENTSSRTASSPSLRCTFSISDHEEEEWIHSFNRRTQDEDVLHNSSVIHIEFSLGIRTCFGALPLFFASRGCGHPAPRIRAYAIDPCKHTVTDTSLARPRRPVARS